MLRYIGRAWLILLAISFLFGCATSRNPAQVAETGNESLLVGVTPNYPPMIFKIDGKLSGMEVDLARRLGDALRRPVTFVELEWDEEIPALLAGKIDIIMSGMSITEPRRVRINFSEPYMKIGLATAVRSEDASRFNSAADIQKSTATIGAIVNTTGSAFVQSNFPHAVTRAFRTLDEAGIALKRRRIDLFIHDAPAIAWLVSENEAELKGLWKLWNVEHLGWGMARENRDLLVSINAILARWKNDGTLETVLNRWVPYAKRFK